MPADVAEFRLKWSRTWDAVFSAAPPVPCKLPVSEIVAVSQNMQMRSRMGTSPLDASCFGALANGRGDAVTAITQVMTNVLRNLVGGTSMPANPITFCGTPRQGRLRTSLASVQEFTNKTHTLGHLALCDETAAPPMRPSFPPPEMPRNQPAESQPAPVAMDPTMQANGVKMDGGASDEAKVSPPPAKKTKQSVEDAAAKILRCMTCKSSSKEAMKRPAAAPTKLPAAGDPKQKALKQKAIPAKTAAKSSDGAPPSYSAERSRSQVLYRSGLKGSGQSKVFKYSDDASMKKAIKEAEKMVAAECARRGL